MESINRKENIAETQIKVSFNQSRLIHRNWFSYHPDETVPISQFKILPRVKLDRHTFSQGIKGRYILVVSTKVISIIKLPEKPSSAVSDEGTRPAINHYISLQTSSAMAF